MGRAGCSSILTTQFPAILQSMTAVSQAAALIASTAGSQSKLLAQLPIQLVLSLGRLAYSVQANILPMFSDANDIGSLPSVLSQLLTNSSTLPAWQQAAQVSAYNTLAAMNVAGISVVAGTVTANAYGAGALQSCGVSFLGLLSLASTSASTATVTGALTVANVQTGLVRRGKGHVYSSACNLMRAHLFPNILILHPLQDSARFLPLIACCTVHCFPRVL